MSMINTKDILETIKMIEEEHLDIRTITMGISLRDRRNGGAAGRPVAVFPPAADG